MTILAVDTSASRAASASCPFGVSAVRGGAGVPFRPEHAGINNEMASADPPNAPIDRR
jgi:hypothetical protein